MATEKLIVNDQIEIEASKKKVWEVLTNPDFIKHWDDIPESYMGGHLKMGSSIEWEGYSKLTVTQFEAGSKLTLRMFLPKVKLDPSSYDVSYCYVLTGEGSKNNFTF